MLRSANAALVSPIIQLICFASAFQSFSNCPAFSVPLSTQNSFGRFFSVIIVKNARNTSLESINFNFLESTVPSNRSWWTRIYFTTFLFFDSLSTYAKSIHQNSFLNLASGFILFILPMARKTFEKEGFESKNCLTFDTDRLIAFTMLGTDP